MQRVVEIVWSQCTAEEWADFCTNWRTYATEYVDEFENLMTIFRMQDSFAVGRVNYKSEGGKTYWINKNAARPTQAMIDKFHEVWGGDFFEEHMVFEDCKVDSEKGLPFARGAVAYFQHPVYLFRPVGSNGRYVHLSKSIPEAKTVGIVFEVGVDGLEREVPIWKLRRS